MKESLLKAWVIHNDKNILLLNNLEESALALRSAPKSRNIGEQLVHMHNTRITWTGHVARNIYDKSLLLDKSSSPSAQQLMTAFRSSAQKIEEIIHTSWEKEGKLPSFKTGLIPFISYLVSHESHHRGNILLTLKLQGIKLPDASKWSLWEWV